MQPGCALLRGATGTPNERGRTMKIGISVAAVLVLALVLWISVPFVAPHLAEFVVKNSGLCPSGNLLQCKDLLSALGATGDIFGVVTSLFSGLALFGVAISLWFDAIAKREARKPLVFADLDGDSVVLDKPKHGVASSLDITISAKVINGSSDAALNVRVDFRLIADDTVCELRGATVKLPLMSGTEVEVKSGLSLYGPMLESLVGCLTDDENCVKLLVITKYSSLENVGWGTSVIYELRCRSTERNRLQSFVQRSQDFDELWKNDAAVALDIDVRSGSWLHERM